LKNIVTLKSSLDDVWSKKTSLWALLDEKAYGHIRLFVSTQYKSVTYRRTASFVHAYQMRNKKTMKAVYHVRQIELGEAEMR